MFKQAIIIPICIIPEDDIALVELGIDVKRSEEDVTEERAFWTIDSAHPDREFKNKTWFYSSKELYLTPIDFEIFVNKINNHLKTNY